MEDITKTGPVGLQGLKGVNQQPQTAADYFKSIRNARVSDFLPAATEDVGVELGAAGYGSSSYDDAVTSMSQVDNINEVRAQEQPWYAQLGNGIAKGVLLAGTAFLDGTIGLLYGGASAIKDGKWSSLWDNDFSNAMQAVTNWSEEAMPNYYTKEELESPWYTNIFTANFLGDKFIKNLGFSVGAIYSGGAYTAPFKIGKVAKAIDTVLGVGATKAVAGVVGSTMAAITEGSIEARNNASDWEQLQVQKLDDWYSGKVQQDLSPYLDAALEEYEATKGSLIPVGDGSYIDPAALKLQNTQETLQAEYRNRLASKERDPEYVEGMTRIQEDKVKMGNADLVMNIPILTLSNWIQFGKFFSRGYDTARRTANIVGRVGEYAPGSTKMGAAIAATKGALSEGTEEISQKAASNIAGDYYETDVNNFIKAKIDPQAEQETLSWINSARRGLAETVSEGSSWEEFFIGALTGAMGIPQFRSPRAQGGGWQSPITLAGGAYEHIKEYQEARAREEEVANYLNNRVQSPEFINYYQGLIRHNKYQSDMDQAVLNDDEFSFKNAEQAQLVSDIAMFDNAGKLNDLIELIDGSFDTSDENLESIVKNTTSTTEDGKTVGPFIDNNGNPLYATPEGKQEMIDALTKAKDNINNTIEAYRKTRNALDIQTGEKLSDEQLEELTWMDVQLQNWANRNTEIAGEVKPMLGKIIGNLDAEYRFWEDMKIKEGQRGKGDLSKLYLSLDKKAENLKKTMDNLQMLRGLEDSALSRVLSNNPKVVEEIKSELEEVDTSVLSPTELKSINKKLDDLVRIGKATETYSAKLKEYISNPEKLAADQTEAREETQAAVDQAATQDFKSRLANAQNVAEFRQLYNGEQDAVVKNQALTELDAENNANAKNFKEIQQYDNEVVKALNTLGENDAVIQDAAALWQAQLNSSNTLEEVANPSSIFINDDQFFMEDAGGDIQEGTRRFEEARYALQKALGVVNNDIKFKDRFSDSFRAPVDENIQGKGTDKDSTGDSGTSTVAPANGTRPAPAIEVPVGNITPAMVQSENSDMNKRVETQRTLDQSQQGQRQYYRPAVPELHIEGSKEGDFRPFDVVVAEREPGVDFSGIYSYLRDNGAFSYVNAAKIKPGDKVGFMIDPDFNDHTIFMVDTRNNQVIGSIDESDTSVARYEGLQGVINKVRSEYAAHKSKSGTQTGAKAEKFFASPKTQVSKMMVGRVPYSTEERGLGDIPGVGEEGAQPMFGIIKNGVLATNEKIDDRQLVKPVDMSQKDGRLYLLIPNAAGTYTPAAVRVKHFNNQEFNLGDATIAATPMGKSMNDAFTRLAEATGQDDVSSAVKDLAQDLYMQDVMVTWFDAAAGSGIVISKKVRKPDGTYEMTKINGQDQIKEDKQSIYFQSSKKSIEINGLEYSYEAAREAGNVDMSLFGQPKAVEDIRNEILRAIMKFNLPLQVSTSKINTPGYNNRLIKSGILTSNLSQARVIGSWFTTDYFDNSGNLRQAISPASVKPNSGRKVNSPVGGTEGVVTGTRVVVGNTNYVVDLKSSIITNETTGERRGFRVGDEHLIDMAWAQESFGDTTESSVMTDNKVITPSGRVLDRNTGRYLSDTEAQKVKDKIAGRAKALEAKLATAKKVEADLMENQKKIDKSRTDGDFYYILEEDGEYHPYDRVHKRLGDNWIQSEAQKQALQDVRSKLMSVANDVRQFDAYLDHLVNHYKQYGLDFSEFKGKTDNQSINTIVAVIRDKMAGTQSRRALEAGSAVDSVIRGFFTMKEGEQLPVRPSNMSESAYNLLISRLTEIKTKMGDKERFLTNNIVLFQKYQDGTRVAGEVDILSVDQNGDFHIYDVKTSRYSFGDFVDRSGKTVNYFESKAPTQRMSNRDYYTLQLSAYKNLFESQYGVPVTKLAILPFVLGYNGDMVTNIVGQKGILIKYNPAVNVPLVSPVMSQPTGTQETQGQKSTLPIFSAVAETMEPVNRVLPENAFEEGGEVGYYEYNGKLYSGYLKKLADINNIPVFLTKVRDRGFGREGEFGSTSEYLTVFPNGKAISTRTNSASDAEASSVIQKALSGNPEKVAALASESTQIMPNLEALDFNIRTQQETQPSGAAIAAQKEAAVNQKSAKRTRHKLRETDSSEHKVWDRKAETNWLKRVLPQLAEDERLRVMNGLVQVAENGPTAWGMFHDGIITLSNVAAEGTLYHEAFHAVFNMMLDPTQREALYKEAKALFGEKSELELEEDMAEAFREYTMDRETRSVGRRILDFFKNLIAKVMNWNQMQPHLTSLYSAINRGKYSRVNPNGVNAERYRLVGQRGAERFDKTTGSKFSHSLTMARLMEQEGRAPEAIKWATGWERGADDLWRLERPDAKFMKDSITLSAADLTRGIKLSDVLADKELFAMYPAFEESRIHFVDSKNPYASGNDIYIPLNSLVSDSFNQREFDRIVKEEERLAATPEFQEAVKYYATNPTDAEMAQYTKEHPIVAQVEALTEQRLALSAQRKRKDTNQTLQLTESMKGTILHELQHLIQGQEWFTRGATYTGIDGHTQYFRNSGEVEARNVERRMNKSWIEKMSSLARDTEDVARENQLYGSKWDSLDSYLRGQLMNKGWTKEKFNSVSALERENAIECVSL